MVSIFPIEKAGLFIHMLKSISEKRPFINHSLPVAEIMFNPVSKTGSKEAAIEIEKIVMSKKTLLEDW